MQGSKLEEEKFLAGCGIFATSILTVCNGYLAYSEGNPLPFIVSFLGFLSAGFHYSRFKAEDQELAGVYIENYHEHDL